MIARALVAIALTLSSAAVCSAAVTPPAITQTAKPAPDGASAVAGRCRLEIAGNDLMQYDKKELQVPSTCKAIEVVLKHTGRLPLAAMGHNWVLAKTSDSQSLDNAGIGAGVKNNHVPPGDKRVIAAIKLVGGGQSATVTFPGTAVAKGGDYTFFCSFPGHFGIMKGKFIVQ